MVKEITPIDEEGRWLERLIWQRGLGRTVVMKVVCR